MSGTGKTDAAAVARANIRAFTLFRVFFTARFYYPVYALLFLDYGLTLEQFGILNGIWALTIVLLEVPSGALADTLGRKRLLVAAGVFMMVEMAVLLAAPVGGGAWLFVLFLANRIFSGAAEAAASGADEALTYDSMRTAGIEGEWGHVLERVHRDTSLAFFFAMLIGAAVYDPVMVNSVFHFVGLPATVSQSQLVKLPVLLTFLSGVVVFATALRMRETHTPREGSVRATLVTSYWRTLGAGRWIWANGWPFAIILAAMALDSVIRQFLTLASEYWKIIRLPIASYGLIGSGMALLGLFVPTVARLLSERYRPATNFLLTSAGVFIGLAGLGFAVPYWGILPAVLLYVGMGLTGYFVSRYLNEASPSEHRATVLSFRGLSTNVAYGGVSLLYSVLIASIRAGGEGATALAGATGQDAVFVEALQWFPWYFLVTVVLVFAVYRFRFGGGGRDGAEA